MTDGINHEHAAEVLDKIQSYPENFYMGSWYTPYEDSSSIIDKSYGGLAYIGPDPSKTECGTTFCVAGWSEMITKGRVQLDGILVNAEANFGIPHDVGLALFYNTRTRAIRALEVMAKPESTLEDVREALGPGYVWDQD